MKTETTPIDLGDRVRCKVTNLEGIVMGMTRYLYGCVRVGIQPAALHQGRPVEAYWVDLPQLELVDRGVVAVKPAERETGGPMPSIPTRNQPG
jgi:hypothetical protein